jgi:hypothetical protein
MQNVEPPVGRGQWCFGVETSPFSNRRLPNAWLTQQDGVVLLAAGQDLRNAHDLLFPANHLPKANSINSTPSNMGWYR